MDLGSILASLASMRFVVLRTGLKSVLLFNWSFQVSVAVFVVFQCQ